MCKYYEAKAEMDKNKEQQYTKTQLAKKTPVEDAEHQCASYIGKPAVFEQCKTFYASKQKGQTLQPKPKPEEKVWPAKEHMEQSEEQTKAELEKKEKLMIDQSKYPICEPYKIDQRVYLMCIMLEQRE